VDETTDKEKAGNQPACLDLFSLSFQLTSYIIKTLLNLTVCFERKAGINAQLKCEARIHHTQFEYLNH
jgi:hypothetical protein